MRRRHPLPTIWLMTDERIGDLEAAIAQLPRRSGIVFRHYTLPPSERRALFKRIETLARRYRHVLLLADTPQRARAWGADGAHDRSPRTSRGIRTSAVHNAAERIGANRAKADLIFVSPAFPTRSHPGAATLGPIRLGLVAGRSRSKTIALGGMTTKRAKRLRALKIYGWAAIDAFSPP
jgi:thiamine-phosphate pyrophosphorylase